MFGPVVSFAFIALLLMVGVRTGTFEAALRILSRIFVSGRRRELPVVQRGGGLAGLPTSLAELLRHGRQLDAAVMVLRERSPAYHRSFESSVTSILDDRRQQALRRDFEDAVIHVARALDRWCEAMAKLDDRARARLDTAATSVPDAHDLLEDFPWLPRHVYQVGHLHFRSDEPEFERRVFALHDGLRHVEESLTRASPLAYR